MITLAENVHRDDVRRALHYCVEHRLVKSYFLTAICLAAVALQFGVHARVMRQGILHLVGD